MLEIVLILILEFCLLIPLIYIIFIRKMEIFSPLVVFIAVYWLYFGFPSAFYLFYIPNYVPDTKLYLTQAALYEIIGILFFYIGYIFISTKTFVKILKNKLILRAIRKIIEVSKFNRNILTEKNLKLSKNSMVFIISFLTLVSLSSLFYYMYSVGGFGYYLTHLGNTNELALGKVYFIWGITLIKVAALIGGSYIIFYKLKKYYIASISYTLLAFIVISLIGARQIVVVSGIEVIILVNYLYKKIKWLYIILIAFFLVVFVLVYGEYRIHTGVTNKTFITQLINTYTNPEIINQRLTNNYFDSVQTFSMVLYHTQSKIKSQNLAYEYGETYLSLFIQPIPRRFRPVISTDNTAKFFCAGGKGYYCRVISSLGELYLNFGGFGIAIGMILFGMINGLVYSLFELVFTKHKNNKIHDEVFVWFILFYAIYLSGIFVLVRGYFIGAATSILMDIVPVFVIFILLFVINGKKFKNDIQRKISNLANDKTK